MLYKKLSLFTIILLFTLTGVALGSSSKRINFFAGAGGGYAVGALGERAEFGFLARLGVGYRLIDVPSGGFEVATFAQFSRFPSTIDTDGDFSFSSVGTDLRLTFEQMSGSVFYLILGGGVSSVKRSSFVHQTTQLTSSGEVVLTQDIPSYTEKNLFISPGIGFLLGDNNKLRPFFELRFSDVSGAVIPDLQFLSATVGIRF